MKHKHTDMHRHSPAPWHIQWQTVYTQKIAHTCRLHCPLACEFSSFTVQMQFRVYNYSINIWNTVKQTEVKSEGSFPCLWLQHLTDGRACVFVTSIFWGMKKKMLTNSHIPNIQYVGVIKDEWHMLFYVCRQSCVNCVLCLGYFLHYCSFWISIISHLPPC